jgi:hypothetical protein
MMFLTVCNPWATASSLLERVRPMNVYTHTEQPEGSACPWISTMEDGLEPRAVDCPGRSGGARHREERHRLLESSLRHIAEVSKVVESARSARERRGLGVEHPCKE